MVGFLGVQGILGKERVDVLVEDLPLSISLSSLLLILLQRWYGHTTKSNLDMALPSCYNKRVVTGRWRNGYRNGLESRPASWGCASSILVLPAFLRRTPCVYGVDMLGQAVTTEIVTLQGLEIPVVVRLQKRSKTPGCVGLKQSVQIVGL